MSEYLDLPNIEPTQENNIPETENKKPDPHLNQKILVGVVIIVVVLAVVFGLRNESSAPTNESDEIVDDNGAVIENSSESSNFDYLIPSEWGHTEVATVNIGLLGAGQTISGGIVQDPTDENIVYFASLLFTGEPETSLISVYRYYLSNNNFERLYRAEYQSDEFTHLESGVPGFGVYGYDDGKLIVLAHIVGASAGPCTQPLLLGMNDRDNFNLLSMEITEPYGGFTEYDLPENVIEQSESDALACQASM